jgi:hypothetical protein
MGTVGENFPFAMRSTASHREIWLNETDYQQKQQVSFRNAEIAS